MVQREPELVGQTVVVPSSAGSRQIGTIVRSGPSDA